MSKHSEIISYGTIENKLMHPHCNPGMEIVLVEEGRLEWAVEGVSEVLGPGMVFFTLPWQAHGSRNMREPRNRISYVLFELDQVYSTKPELISIPNVLGFSSEENQLISNVLITARHHAWPASDLLKNMFPELIHKLNGSTDMDVISGRTLLRSVLVELVNIISTNPQVYQFIPPTLEKVKSFLRDLKGSIDQPWTLEKMAEGCGIKRTQFSNITRELTGYPPGQYLARIRIERACELLCSTNLSVTDIAFECGYGSSQYFSDTFRKYTRMTPSAYRKHYPELDAIMKVNWENPEIRSVSDELERSARLSGGRG